MIPTIRPATLDDLQAVAEIHVAAWRAAYGTILPAYVLDQQTVKKRKQSWERRIRETGDCRSGETAVVEAGGQVVGFATLGHSRDDDADATTGELWGLYLAPEHWRKGIGRHVVHWVLAKLAERGYREATLWVLEQNDPARRFYEAVGFGFDRASRQITIGIPLIEVRYRRLVGGPGAVATQPLFIGS